MTTVFPSTGEVDTTRPGTHVLIIGVGGYPHLQGGDPKKRLDDTMGLKQLSSPPVSAQALAEWFTGRHPNGNPGFHNPTAPLASIEMLVSPPWQPEDKAQPHRCVLDGDNAIAVDRATWENISACYGTWLKHVKGNPDNIGVFYFCGHGVTGLNDYVLPEDFGHTTRNRWHDAIDIVTTVRAARRRVPGALYIFIDACRQNKRDSFNPGATPQSLELLKFKNLVQCLSLLMLWATGEGQKAFSEVGKVSRFTAALIKTLSGYEGEAVPNNKGWMVTGNRLAESVSEILETENKSLKPDKHQHAKRELIGSQPFHFLTAAPDRVYGGIPSSWSVNPEVRQLLAAWGAGEQVPENVLELLAERLEERYFEKNESDLPSLKDYFEIILPTMLRWKGEEATELRKRVRFRLLDRPEESWTVVLEPPEATVIPRDTGHADLVIKITSDCMQALLAGNFDAKKAIADGNIELYGDLSLLRAVGQLFAGSARP
jgi:hypothetical protein